MNVWRELERGRNQRAGLPAAAIYNVHLKPGIKPFKPLDFFGEPDPQEDAIRAEMEAEYEEELVREGQDPDSHRSPEVLAAIAQAKGRGWQVIYPESPRA